MSVGGVLATIGIVALVVIVVLGAIAESNACIARSGHIVTQYGSGIGFGANGQAAPAITSTSFCLSSDGRILE
jgi:hypothetical protein